MSLYPSPTPIFNFFPSTSTSSFIIDPVYFIYINQLTFPIYITFIILDINGKHLLKLLKHHNLRRRVLFLLIYYVQSVKESIEFAKRTWVRYNKNKRQSSFKQVKTEYGSD
jgi:hypothetical protein